jgi:hypothetical protein
VHVGREFGRGLTDRTRAPLIRLGKAFPLRSLDLSVRSL